MPPILLAATLLPFGNAQQSVVKADAPFDAAALTWSGAANVREMRDRGRVPVGDVGTVR